jgi:cytochrome b
MQVLWQKALLKLSEDPQCPPDAALYSAFAKRRSLISKRIRQLLEHHQQNPTKLHKVGAVVFAAVVTSMVMSSTFVGNYQIEQESELSKYLSDLVQKFFES